MKTVTPVNERCSIARSLSVLGEKWALLIVRDVTAGHGRFNDLRERLGVSPDVLTERLTTLVDSGILTRRSYREDGARERHEYVLTAAGEDLGPVLSAFSQWGDKHLPSAFGPSVRYIDGQTGRPVHVDFVDDRGQLVEPAAVQRTPGPGALIES